LFGKHCLLKKKGWSDYLIFNIYANRKQMDDMNSKSPESWENEIKASIFSTNSVKSFSEEYMFLDIEGFSFCPKRLSFRVPAFSFIYGLSSIIFILTINQRHLNKIDNYEVKKFDAIIYYDCNTIS